MCTMAGTSRRGFRSNGGVPGPSGLTAARLSAVEAKSRSQALRRAARGMAVPESGRAPPEPFALQRLARGRDQVARLQQTVGALGDRDGTLGVLPQRRARDTQVGR